MRKDILAYPAARTVGDWVAIIAVLTIFCTKYMSAMLQQNTFWRSGAWYQFLESSSPASQAGLLDPAAMEPYYRTLSISLGHQLIAAVNARLGFDTGTAFLYVAIAALFTTSAYLISLHFTRSNVKAFFITLLIMNTDVLVMAHIGGCGSPAQGPTRDYMALGFILLGFYFLLESKLYPYWLCLFLGFLLHLPHGMYAFALLLPLTVLSAKNPRFVIFHIASFAITALGLYLYQSTGATPVAPEIRELWFKWVYIFNGGHIFFDHSTHYLTPNYAFFSVVLAGVAIAAARPELRRLVLTIVPMWVLMAIVTTFFVYVVPVMLVHQLTPYRSSLLVSAILLILLLRLFLDQFSMEVPLWKTLLALSGLIALLSGTFAGIALLATIGCLVLAIDTEGRTRSICLAAMAGCIVFVVLCLEDFKIYDAGYFARDGRNWAAAAVVLLVLGVVRHFRQAPLSIRGMATPIACIVVFALVALTPSRYVSQPTQAMLDKLDDYTKASQVIRENSLASEPVLTAPLIDMPMLEVMAGRGSILQLVKAHVPYLAPSLLPRFNSTLRSFGIDIASVKGTWVDLVREAPGIWTKTMTAENLNRAGAQYNAHLVLTYKDHELSLPALYRGSYFTVYKLTP